MGVDVILMKVTQQGTSPKRRKLQQLDFVLDPDDLFARHCLASGLPMLSRVDPYGDVILTSAEMDQFIHEIMSPANPVDGVLQRRLAEIGALASRCRDGQDLELHLQGD